MKVDYHPHISLSETNDIIRAIKRRFSFDLSVFSMANLQLLISSYIYEKGIHFPDVLISRMNDYPDAFDELLCWLDVTDSEMFRNPDAWLRLNSVVLPELLKKDRPLKVWVPSCSTGEELFSFVIMALENGYRDRIELSASTMSKLRLKEAEKGLFMGNSLDISKENYTRAGGKIEIEQYIERIDKFIVRKKLLRENIDFRIQDIIPGPQTHGVDLILFKNRLIYYAPKTRNLILSKLLESLAKGGYLVLGYKEEIVDKGLQSKVKLVYDEEKIYQLI